jgi:hypothetical protein
MVYVLRRGYSVGWFFVILVLGSVGFFILPVYLLIWALHRSFIKKDTVTRQCPNCGGFKSSPGFSKRRHEADPVVYAYSCYLCGNKWAWQEGTAYPHATVNPALIRTGQAYLDHQAQQAAVYYEMERQRRLRENG